MIFAKFSDKVFCATWFGGLALIMVLPYCLARFFNIKEWSLGYAAFAVCLEGVIPAVMAAFFGSRFGLRICNQSPTLSSHKSFVIGLKISIASAFAWVLLGFLTIVVASRLFPDTSRFAGGILVLAIFGLPVYGAVAGLGAIALRMLVIRRALTKDGSGQKTEK